MNNNRIDYKYNISFNNDVNLNQIEILKKIEYLETNNNSIYSKVFNNIYIRRIIFNHLNKFNIFYPVNFEFKSLKEFQQFKHKEYLHRVTLMFKLDFEDDQFELNQLPINIKHITIILPAKINDEHYEIIQVPDHIEAVNYIRPIEANYANSFPKQPHSSKIKTLFIDCLEEEILPNRIPHSVTDLTMMLDRLSNNILPPNLKKLTIRNLQSFEDNCLQIESLTHLSIYYSTSLILDQLSTPFFKNLIKLEFINGKEIIDSNIQFPDNLKELNISCKSFNYISQIKTNQICPFQFPSSLEILSILVGDDIYFDLLPPNLKSLKISCSSIIDNKGQSILPSKLKKLVISEFNQVLQVNQLPSSLTYLDLGNKFNRIIDVNVLPANLHTIVLGFQYSQAINPLAIPQQLKLLQIIKLGYSHSINLTPSTHPNTAISLIGDNINLYYQATSPDYNQIRVLILPYIFNSPLSTLQLQNKPNLEYLHLGNDFDFPIELSDLPISNNIKTLILSNKFSQFINLEHFQNLETLILNENSNPTIITTTIDKKQKHVHYNNYKLKSIMVSPKNVRFLKQLDINFYQFIKYKI